MSPLAPLDYNLTVEELATRERELVAMDAQLAEDGHQPHAARRQRVADRLYAVRSAAKALHRQMKGVKC